MEPKAVALFSGGLDSILAVRVLQDQAIEMHAFHMVLDVTRACRGPTTRRWSARRRPSACRCTATIGRASTLPCCATRRTATART